MPIHFSVKVPSVVVLLLCLFSFLFGQSELPAEYARKVDLYKIEAELVAGNKASLFALGEYFESRKKVVDNLGYHRIDTTEAEVAKRMVQENFVFGPSEMILSEATTKREFIEFLKANESKLAYSKEAEAFLVTPFGNRDVEFEVLEISRIRKAELNKKLDQLLKLDWVKQDGIDILIAERNPEALLRIAYHLFRTRDRWNRYYYKEEDDLGLLELLTGTQIVVKNERNAFSYHIGSDYSPVSKLNLLIYFSKFYKDYRYDPDKNAFVRPNVKTKTKPEVRTLFESLSSEDDEVALNAFIRLTEFAPAEVAELADEFNRAASLSRDTNSSLPTFPFRFLKQLSLLTDYCRKNGIDYRGPEKVRSHIESLKKEMTFSDRYQLENRIIQELTLNDLTAFEYWSLIYQNEWDVTYSAGRILDRAYGRKWRELLADDRTLTLYLKKSKLFDGLGIIGAVNKYVDKFIDSPNTVTARLKSLKTSDPDIRAQAKAASAKALVRSKVLGAKPENYDAPSDLESRMKRFAGIRFLDEGDKKELVDLLSRISYEQIPIAVTYVKKISFLEPSPVRSKYEFLMDDWGFKLVGDFEDDDVRKEFLANYSKMSQSELYAFYLKRGGFEFRKPDGSLDFDKIYEMLKYDVVEALAGGGGGRRERHVYSLIKLLENRFGTALGYMNKLCMSKNVYACSSLDRAQAWMNYLIENKRLQRVPDEPTSFTYVD